MYSILLSAGWPIWPLLIISIVGLAIVIERAWYLRQIQVIPKSCLESAFSLANQLFNGKPVNEQAIQDLKQSGLAGSLFACLLKEKTAGSTADTALEELQVTAQTVWLKLERYLGALATIATVAPLLGLFGTVVGMIEIFGSSSPTGNSNPTQLAHGISIALYNTAFGLVVAIPSMIFYRHFRATVDNLLLEMEMQATKLVEILQGERQA